MTKLLVKSKKNGLTEIEEFLLAKTLDGTIERFYDSSNRKLFKGIGSSVTKWVNRGLTKGTATQTSPARYPVYVTSGGVSSLQFLSQDRALNFPFPDGFNGVLFISSLDGFLRLPVSIDLNTSVRASGSSFNSGAWAWHLNQQSPIIGMFFISESQLDSDPQLISDIEEKLFEWHISKGGASDNFGGLTSFFARFLGGFSFYRWATSFPAINTQNATTMRAAFLGCYSLTSLPWMNTAKVTSLHQAFADLQSLQAIPVFNTSSVVDLSVAFANCYQIRSFPPLDFSKVISFAESFRNINTNSSNLKRFPLIDTTSATSFFAAWLNSALTQESVDNILISIAAGFASSNKNLRGSNQNVGGAAIVGGTNAAPTNILRTWDYLKDQTESLTPDSDAAQWTSVNVNTDTFIFAAPHRLAMGREVKVKATAGGGITNNTKYFVIWVSLTELKLATTLENALKGVAIDITGFVSTIGRLKEVYEFNLDVPPWTALKSVFSTGISGQQAKNYILNVHGINIATN